MRNSLKKNLVTFFFKQFPSWVNAGELERMEFRNRSGKITKPSSVSRELRLLESKYYLAVKYEGEAQSAVYKYLPKAYRSNYIPVAKRPAYKKNILWKVPLEELANHKKPLDIAQEEWWNSL